MQTLTVIVPAFNEEKTLKQSLSRLISQSYITQIIIINDGSTDNTAQIIIDFKNLDSRIEVVSNHFNKGKGYSLNVARSFVSSDYVVIHDADLEYDPKDLEEMYKLADGNKLIIGSRFIGNKKRNNLYRRTMIANKIMSIFFSIVHQVKVSDIATCYKMMPSKFFKNTTFVEHGFSIEIEMVAKFFKTSRQIVEVPISYNGRSYADGKKIKTSDGFFYLFNTLKYRFY